MIRISHILLTLSCVLCLLPDMHSQQLDSLRKTFTQYRETTFEEKIYAHLERTFHLTGETLWFKAYAVEGNSLKPSDLSRVAYAEVLDRTDLPVLQAKIELSNGMGSGSFFIPASLASGHYRFRIYTNWMKNFGPEFYFHQDITIVNPFIASEKAPLQSARTYQIDFFPEGGHLVAGLTSTVAFRITGQPPQKIAGVLLNEMRDTIASLRPDQNGIGRFRFTPAPESTYYAVFGAPNFNSKSFPLPAISPAGYVMHLLDSGNEINIEVQSRGVHAQEVYLFAHARQAIAFTGQEAVRGGRAMFTVSKEKLPEGITHFTLFDEQFRPRCERLYFTPVRKKLNIELSASQKAFVPRKKVSLRINTSSADGDVPANLSMAVFRVDSLDNHRRTGILPWLWWTADLGAGAIPVHGLDGSAEEIDNLLLTHGWRKFKWDDILERKKSYKFLPEVNGHIISGSIARDGRSQRGVFTYLGSPGKLTRVYGCWSNLQGEVRFEARDFYGPNRIILQTRTDSAEYYQIQIADPFSGEMFKQALPAWKADKKSEDVLLARSIAMQVQDIYYFDTYGERTLAPEIDSSAFYGKPDQIYYLDDYTRFPVMEEVMREYVPGVFVRKRKDGFHLLVVDGQQRDLLPGDPMILLDGVPVLDADQIMALDPLRVQKLEVVKRQYYLGQSVFFGIVNFSTYEGDLGGLELDPRSVTLNYEGLQLKREFFHPQYSRQTESRLPDQRHLLYWAPEITTDQDGNYQVEFFTSDVPGTYAIELEGIDQNGNSGSGMLTFTVENPGDE